LQLDDVCRAYLDAKAAVYALFREMLHPGPSKLQRAYRTYGRAASAKYASVMLYANHRITELGMDKSYEATIILSL
jgi:hypothetical protein